MSDLLVPPVVAVISLAHAAVAPKVSIFLPNKTFALLCDRLAHCCA
jgi:hypothetical protein